MFDHGFNRSNWLAAVLADLSAHPAQISLRYYPCLDSSNLQVERLLSSSRWARDRPEILVVVAGSQTAGQGRYGRQWLSPKGTGLWFTVAVRGELTALCPPPLVVLAARLATVLQAQSIPVVLKWPNDLFLGGGKLAGMMGQRKSIAGQSWLLCGVGVNINPPDHAGLEYPVAGLADCVQANEQHAVAIIRCVVDTLLSPRDWTAMLATQARAHLHYQQPVALYDADGYCGQAAAGAIDVHSGALWVHDAGRAFMVDGRWQVRLQVQ